MAQEHRLALDLDEDVLFHPLPGQCEDGGIVLVMVADDQGFPAVQAPEHAFGARIAIEGEVAEVPDLVIRRYDLVPAPDHRLVHFRDVGERPIAQRDDAGMAEMAVGSEEDHRAPSPCRPAPVQEQPSE